MECKGGRRESTVHSECGMTHRRRRDLALEWQGPVGEIYHREYGLMDDRWSSFRGATCEPDNYGFWTP